MTEVAFPSDFKNRMQAQLSVEWSDFEGIHNHASPVSIRLNPKKNDPDKTSFLYTNAKKIPWVKHGYYLNERPSFTLDPIFHSGAYYVQEASSMLLELAVNQVTEKDTAIRVLDLCAAPGGKSTHLLSLLSNKSLLVSNEVIRTRANVLAENILKWGHDNVVVTNNDPEHFKRLQGFFDVVVVDAPCSGEGLFRKDTQAMNEWSIENTNLCAFRQQRILNDVWPALKENGILIYCTCTYNPEENELNLLRFAREHSVEFVALPIETNWGIVQKNIETVIGYQSYPHRVTGEGFFISVLRKKELQATARIKFTKSTFAKPAKLSIDYTKWLSIDDNTFLQFNDYLLSFPESLTHEIEWLASNLKIVSAGTTIGTIKHTKLIPDHALALSVYLNRNNFPTIPVNKEEAIAYLRKDVFWKENLVKGFCLITYEGRSLGFVNVLDNRLNNLYPAAYRIRMASP
jgi:16S rRNA C967 or C1407 C5-methylase (RsmB/RsmF family)/NOL1/NOP2/fmu family ribosome biogenesis protein